MDKQKKKVFVAMSGGVDSSVTAALLKQKGYDVVGVTMCFSIPNPGTKKPSCCGIEGIEDAKKVARELNIPHYVMDFAAPMNDFIIKDFFDEYLAGRTPNPCARCNQFLKFDILYNKVKALDADYLATGHYAKIVYNKIARRCMLKKAADLKKDQSYFLYGIKKEILPHLLFPIGDIEKDKVREIAKQLNLKVAEKQESQDICFIPRNGYKDFIKKYSDLALIKPGNFVDETGKIVGKHQGIINYTIGQRENLGIALGKRVYVYKIDKERNIVYVGPKDYLLACGFYGEKLNLIADFPRTKVISAQVRLRYNSPEVKAKIKIISNEKFYVEFDKPQPVVTPGQSAVFYKKDMVLGGGIIGEIV